MPKTNNTAPIILITGATGFVGPYLLQALRRSSKLSAAQVVVWGYNQQNHAADPASVDIRNFDEIEGAVRILQPDYVIHMAAQSHVPTSFKNPHLTWDVNVMGSLNLFEAVKTHVPRAGILFISSSEVYGKSFQSGQALDEASLLQPQNPYAASKAAADIMAGQYAAQGLQIIRMRPFNHIGPGQRHEFVVPAFASQIARIEAGQQDPILKVGNLEAQRDFLDVRDVVRAYVIALEKIYTLPAGLALNICSGVPRPISTLIQGLLDLSECHIEISQDPERMRPSDTKLAFGDSSAAARYLGWKAQFPLQQTLLDVLNEWRTKAGR
ncbi:MAG: GDP-mannose 4,6-dehydratase [Desulfuromonadaceae bacterium]